APAPYGSPPAVGGGPNQEISSGRSQAIPSTITRASAASRIAAPWWTTIAPPPTGTGGAGPISPTSLAPNTINAARQNGSAAARTQTTQRRIEWPRRLARASPSIVAPSTAAIIIRVRNRTAQAGTDLPAKLR